MHHADYEDRTTTKSLCATFKVLLIAHRLDCICIICGVLCFYLDGQYTIIYNIKYQQYEQQNLLLLYELIDT